MKVINSPARVRRAQIVSLSLTELMLLLVFMSIAFSFLAKKEGLTQVDRVQKQLEEVTKENVDLHKQLDTRTAELDRLKRFLAEIGVDNMTLRPKGGTIVIGGISYVSTGHAPGAPLCKLSTKYLMSVALLDDNAIQVTESPVIQSDPSLSKLTSLSPFSNGRKMSIQEFHSAAEALRQNMSAASQDCRYAVRALRRTQNADTFDSELHAVERYFYVARS